MLIYVKTLAGFTLTLQVSQDDNIFKVKQIIYEREAIPIGEQWLICAGRHLADEDSLKERGILEFSTLHLVLCFRRR